jgi:hypothetical protein
VNPPRGLLDSIFAGEGEDQQHDGPTFAEIDQESDGGLGGTSDEVFGPLVAF